MEVDRSARTMFARHKLGGQEEDVQWLVENDEQVYVAINWDDSPSTNENDYGSDGRSRGYQEIRRMRRVAEENTDPVVIGAYYGNRVKKYRNSMIVGRVDPTADVHIIHCRRDETPIVYESEQAARNDGVPDSHQMDEDEELENDWVYKALPLAGCKAYDEPRSISFTDYPLLSALRPRYHSFCNWHMAKEHLRAIDTGVDTFRDVEHQIPDPSNRLAPSQLEVVCDEFLRLSEVYEGYAPTLPVGRTLQDVDIVGKTKNGLLFAQVTKEDSESDLEKKGDKLASYTRESDVQLVLFGPDGMEKQIELEDEVQYKSVQKVVETVDADHNGLIDDMFRLPEPTPL